MSGKVEDAQQRRPSLQSNLLPVSAPPEMSDAWRSEVAAAASVEVGLASAPPAGAVMVVATALPAQAAPAPCTTMNLSETITSGSDVYQFVPPSCGDECCGLCCPCSAEVRCENSRATPPPR